MTSASTGAAPPSWRARFASGAAVRLESLIVLAVLCIVMAMLSNAFLSVSNILNILLSTSVFGTLAIGMTFVISSAGIDLSVGSILALSGVVGAILTSNLELPWWIGVLGCLATGSLTGALNGFFVTKAAIPPFIVTLGMLGIARGFALVLSNGVSIYGLPPEIVWLGQGRPFGVPTPVIVLLLAALVAHVLLAHTRFGVYAQVIGDNEGAARAMGVRVERMKVLLYTLSGLLSGLAGSAVRRARQFGRADGGSQLRAHRHHRDHSGRNEPVRRPWQRSRHADRRSDHGGAAERAEPDGCAAFLSANRHWRGADPRSVARPHQ